MDNPVSSTPESALDYAQSILDTVRDPMLVLDDELRIVTASRAFYRIFNVSIVETEGRRIYELGNGQWDIPRLRELLEIILVRESSFDDFAVTHDFPGIGRRSMLLNARKVWRPGNNTHRLLLAIEDITERREAEIENARIGELNRRLLSSSSDSIKLLDLDGKVVSMNKNASIAVGASSETSFLGTVWVSFWEDEGRRLAEQALLEARGGRVRDFEASRRVPHGALQWWHVVLSPVFDVAHEPEFILVISRNVTERRQSQELLEAAHADLERISGELRRSNEDLEQFARVAGHDLRAPLGTMIMFAQMLRRQSSSALGDQGREYLSRIIGGGKRLMTLLEDLLRYSAFAELPVELPAPISAQEACVLALDALKATIDRSSALVECNLAECVRVRVELSRLVQVLQNIIGNAIQYRIPERVPVIRIEAKSHGIHWEFSISDNGPGIDERYWQTIFEPFKRLHGEENPGSGIGLATCKRIVERAGGSIRVDSTLDAGATFYFLLPKAP